MSTNSTGQRAGTIHGPKKTSGNFKVIFPAVLGLGITAPQHTAPRGSRMISKNERGKEKVLISPLHSRSASDAQGEMASTRFHKE